MQRGLFRYDVTACETKVSVPTLFWWILLKCDNFFHSFMREYFCFR